MRWKRVAKLSSGIWLVGLLVGSMLLAGCGGAASADELTGTKWELEELNGRDALDDVLVTMELGKDDALSGSASCNRYIGSWTSEGSDKLTLQPGGTTMMACEQPVMDQEQAFLAALAATTRFDLDEDELELYNAEGKEVAEFERLHAKSLINTNWVAIAINNGENGFVTVLEDTTITALFEIQDDRLSGQSGCNTYTTSFSRDGEEMTIEPAAVTLMACDQPVMDQETKYLQALERTTSYELGKETLILRSEDGSMQVWFKDAN